MRDRNCRQVYWTQLHYWQRILQYSEKQNEQMIIDILSLFTETLGRTPCDNMRQPDTIEGLGSDVTCKPDAIDALQGKLGDLKDAD